MSKVAQDAPPKKIKTAVGVVSYPNLLEARKASKDATEKKYSVTLIFKGGVGAGPLKQIMEAAIDEKYPKGVKRPKLKLPFRNGEEYEDKKGYEEGDIFIQFSRYEKFGEPNSKDGFPVIGPRKDPETGKFMVLGKRDIYPGMMGVVVTKPYYWYREDAMIKNGFSFGLEGFQKVGEGERLGGNEPIDAEEEFEEFEAELCEGAEAALGGDKADEQDVEFDTEE